MFVHKNRSDKLRVRMSLRQLESPSSTWVRWSSTLLQRDELRVWMLGEVPVRQRIRARLTYHRSQAKEKLAKGYLGLLQ